MLCTCMQHVRIYTHVVRKIWLNMINYVHFFIYVHIDECIYIQTHTHDLLNTRRAFKLTLNVIEADMYNPPTRNVNEGWIQLYIRVIVCNVEQTPKMFEEQGKCIAFHRTCTRSRWARPTQRCVLCSQDDMLQAHNPPGYKVSLGWFQTATVTDDFTLSRT